ncbi:hypothetical protein HNR16_000733 [Pseudoclavibacter chungangensis]|uniref:VOC family protein n=1 Tax=Pseudoclavibacter chungangensis TaxID=587635 RepID=UPI00181467B5|nr:VOC family protein [Pseudoclavibacter chungangensis]NYJ65945.1 hypothetical protein [Pseudoclavibacter chungangensis]
MSRVVHFEIHASEPDALIDFYTAVFGWTFTRFGDMDYWSISTADADGDDGVGINGGLTRREGSPPGPSAPVNGANIVVAVDDVDATFSLAIDQGASSAAVPEDLAGVGRVANIRDPDGNLLGLITPDLSAMSGA